MVTQSTKSVKKENDVKQKDERSMFMTFLRKCFIGIEEEKPKASKDIFQAYIKGLSQYAQFWGRTCRYDYWGFWTVDVIFLATIFLSNFLPLIEGYIILMMVPRLAIFSRRLHDISKSFLLFGLLPIGLCVWLIHYMYIMSDRYLLNDESARSMAGILVIFLWLYLLIVPAREGGSKENFFGKPIIEDKKHNKNAKRMILINVLIQIPLVWLGLAILAISFPWHW